jgi:hypothetical protein
VALNFGAGPQAIALHGLGTGALVLSTHLDRDGRAELPALPLRGHEGVVIALD